MRTDVNNRHLFLRTGVKDLTILSNVSSSKNPSNANKFYEDELKISFETGNFIIDFKPIEDDRVLILTLSGNILLFSYRFAEKGNGVFSLLSQ